MKTFNQWLEANKNFKDADFTGESGQLNTYRIRYAYKKGDKYYTAWGYADGQNPRDAVDGFLEFIMDENGYEETKALEVKRVPRNTTTNPNDPGKAIGLTNRTPTNQKINMEKYKNLGFKAQPYSNL